SSIASLANEYRKKQGGIILLLPPLPPHYEKLLQSEPLTANYLKVTKAKLNEWAQKEKIIIIDAGQSENFGCKPNEFFDDHHAVSACYQKIFKQFWQDFAINKTMVGLYHPH